jgi:hypothetical protein
MSTLTRTRTELQLSSFKSEAVYVQRVGVVIYRLHDRRVGRLDSRFTLSTVALARFHFTHHTARRFCSVGVASDLHNHPYDSEGQAEGLCGL